MSDTVAEIRSGALLNGKPVVGFEITRARGAGEVDVAVAVRDGVEQMRAAHPDLTITEAFNFVDPVIENYEGSMILLYEGALPRRARGLVVPARLACHVCERRGATAFGHPDLPRHPLDGLHASTW